MKKQIVISESEIISLADWQDRFAIQLDDSVNEIDFDLLVDFIEFKSYLNKYGYVFLDTTAQEALKELLSIDNSRN